MTKLPDPNRNMLSLQDSGKVVAYLPSQSHGEEPEQVLAFSHYAWLLRRHAWKIALVVTISTALMTLYCFLAKPVYESTARITIDQKIPSTVIGQDSTPVGSSDVDQMMNTEIQIIKSDAVLRPVAEEFHLLPVSALYPGQASAPQQQLSNANANANANQDQPGEAEAENQNEEPVSLPNLTVARLPASLLIDVSYRSHDPREAARVANAVAHSYITRGMEMRAHSSMGLSSFMEKQIAELKQNMENSAHALAGYESRLGMINPDEKTSILGARLMQLNTEYTAAENDRMQKETDFHALESGAPVGTAVGVGAAAGSVAGASGLSSAALEVSPQAANLSRLEEQMHAAEEKLAVAKTVYGPNYAEYKRAANDLAEVTRQYQQARADIGKRVEVSYREAQHREGLLRASLASAKDESDKLNASSAEYQELKREAEANKTLYDELFRKIKEAGINAGFQSSAIRIADEARPEKHPVFPKKGVFIALTFLLSLIGSVVVAVVADMLDKSLRDPDQARRLTGIAVVGTLPKVNSFSLARPSLLLENGEPMSKREQRRLQKNWFATPEFYKESIATMLSTILYDRSGRRPRSLLVTSAGPGEGKSSCAAHMAMAHASHGKRTLLIDADLRCPFQHNYFKLENDKGLASSILDGSPLKAVSQKVEGYELLDVVVAGTANGKAFDRVGQRVAELLVESSKEYDLIIVDAPPMLGLAEPIQIACVADGVLVIGHAGATNQQAITTVLNTLERVHANVIGLVLNQVRQNMSESYQRYRSYYPYATRLASKAG